MEDKNVQEREEMGDFYLCNNEQLIKSYTQTKEQMATLIKLLNQYRIEFKNQEV